MVSHSPQSDLHSQSPNGTELWVPLLEKAYAKVFKSYEAIEGGLTNAALADLTGGISQTLRCVLVCECVWGGSHDEKTIIASSNRDFFIRPSFSSRTTRRSWSNVSAII